MTPQKLMMHPDDLLFFHEVTGAMRIVARQYQLPLRSIDFLPMPEAGMVDRMGECTHDGHIRLVLRCTVDGQWCEHPLSPNEVWDTAAHELAHLKHFDHGESFHTLRLELLTALTNKRNDTPESYRDKIIGKLVKMQAQRDGEAALGNSEAAEAFASAINRMMLEHELHPSDIDYARTADRDPVVEVQWKQSNYGVPAVQKRVAWQESLARVVARAHLCKFLIRKRSNDIYFVGTRAHAMVAEYTFGVLARSARHMSWHAREDYRNELRKQYGIAPGRSLKDSGDASAFGFRESWLEAFITRIAERLEEARQAAVAAAETTVPGGSSTALIRLDGALAKAQRYIDDKFSHRRGGGLAALGRLDRNNSVGASRGRAAANAMTLGRRGLTSAATPKQLK